MQFNTFTHFSFFFQNVYFKVLKLVIETFFTIEIIKKNIVALIQIFKNC